MSALPVAKLIHVAPGRLRLRVLSTQRDPAFFANLVRSMESVDGVGNVHASSLTGTVLLEGTTLTVEQFGQLAELHRWFAVTPPSPTQAMPTTVGRDVMQAAAPLLVLALAAVQGARGHLLPSALSLVLRAVEMGRAQAKGLR